MCSIIALYSCKEEEKTKTTDVNTVQSQDIKESSISDFDKKYGLWSGEFVADIINYEAGENFSNINRMTIVIQDITDDKIEGYSVSAGNIRQFVGEVKKTDSTRYVVAKEPGDHKYDGTFKFNIADNNDSIFGEWISNRKDLPVLSRKFSIKKKDFKYNPNNMLDEEKNSDGYDDLGVVDWVNGKNKIMNYEGEKYESYVNRAASKEIFSINGSTRKLTEKELKNLHKLDLEIIRNTIYARHGYSFVNRGARQYFDNIEWYIPLYNNVENELTSTEKENIALLKRFEKYATDNYQQFGR